VQISGLKTYRNCVAAGFFCVKNHSIEKRQEEIPDFMRILTENVIKKMSNEEGLCLKHVE
jgi:hypothetical protein